MDEDKLKELEEAMANTTQGKFIELGEAWKNFANVLADSILKSLGIKNDH